jgi:hypothetical protein
MTSGHPIGEQYQAAFEMTLRYPRGLYLVCKNSKQPSCANAEVIEPGGIK